MHVRYLPRLVAAIGLSIVLSGPVVAQQQVTEKVDLGKHLVTLESSFETVDTAYAEAKLQCEGSFEAVQEFIGPMDDPTAPRDEACTDHLSPRGERLDGFGQCSEDHYAAYEAAIDSYRKIPFLIH